MFLKIKLLPLFLGLLFACGLSLQNGFRLSWFERTRYKLLLYDGPQVELFQNKSLEQSFVANYPGLAGIDILFKRNDQAAGGQNVVFHLKNSCVSENDIVTLSGQISTSEDLAFHSFTFAPLDDSAGRTYCLLLEAPEATRENPVWLQLSNGDLYPAGTFTIHQAIEPDQNKALSPASLTGENTSSTYKVYLPMVLNQSNNPYRHDIGFQLHYKGRLIPTLQQLLARLTQNKPYPLGQVWFYGTLTLSYLILLGGLLYLARQTTRLNPKK